MYFLLVFGDDVENFLRPLRYIALIAIAAFVGDLLHIASATSSTIPCIGASGGIAGVITFYALAFPQAKIGFLWRNIYYFRWIRLPGVVLSSSSGLFSKSSALTNKRSESARFPLLRIWGAPESVWLRGSLRKKPRLSLKRRNFHARHPERKRGTSLAGENRTSLNDA